MSDRLKKNAAIVGLLLSCYYARTAQYVNYVGLPLSSKLLVEYWSTRL